MEEIWKTVRNGLNGGKRKTATSVAVFGVFSLSLWERAPDRTATTLAKHHLRPARQTSGNGAKVIATRNWNARQLFGQRFLNQR